MFCRLLSIVFAVAGIGLLAGGGYLALQPEVVEPGLIVEEPERILNGVVPHREQVIDFRVHNRTSRTLRVLGTTPVC